MTDLSCPVVHGQAFDPLDPEQAADPYPWLRAAQARRPVFHLPEQDMWCGGASTGCCCRGAPRR
ncbi:MAG TPA: hypothetical protein VGH89_22400 [Pseudonocardia sp.]